MDTKISASKRNRLFWLGRYVERTYNAVSYMMDFYDRMIDLEAPDYADFCNRMGIPMNYKDAEDFMSRFLFSKEDTCSCVSYMDCVIGNGMLLRDVVTTSTFSYLLLAQRSLEFAKVSDSPCVELQSVLDYIMAFRGSFDDTSEAEDARNIAKMGGMIERVSTLIRNDAPDEKIRSELAKLINRMYKTDIDRHRLSADIITSKALEGFKVSKNQLLNSVEYLFIV